MSTACLNQISSELFDLNAELESLQARALHRVEAIENDFHGVVLPDDVKTNFIRMRKLITRV